MEVIVNFHRPSEVIEWNGQRLDDFGSDKGWFPEWQAEKVKPGDRVRLFGETTDRTVLSAKTTSDELRLTV